MLSAKNEQTCKRIFDTALSYCNSALFDHKGKKLDIELEIVEHNDYNAAALSSRDPYKVTINTEVFEKVFKLLNCLLSAENPQFYSVVSLESGENYSSKRANLYLDLLFETAVKYIVYHELGHIYNGHVDYVIKNHPIANLNRQAIEMDADSFAATRLIGQLTFNENIDYYNSIEPNLIKGKEHALILALIASYISFGYFKIGKNRNVISKLEDLRECKYLPLRTRADYYCRSALNAFKGLNPDSSMMLGCERIDIEYLREITPNIEQWMNLYMRIIDKNNVYDMNNSKEELNDMHYLHCDYLDLFWNQTMKSELEAFSFFELAE